MGIAVLGPLTIEGEWRNLARRDRVVLAALAVHPGEVVSAGVLADVLWGDGPPASEAKVVQGCVVRLRKLLGGHAIETSPDGYRLSIAHDEIDSQRFERAVGRAGVLLASGEAERAAVVLADVLTLWRGNPLDEVSGWDTAQIEIARLTELRQLAEELYVEASLRSGGYKGVLAKAQALTAEAPLRERRWALLATAQYQAGRQGEALETLRRLRVVLNTELGLDPSPEIDELEQAILRQDPALLGADALPEPSAVCPYQGLRPYDVDDAELFFGRGTDVAAGLRKLSDTSILAVIGPSGCGKSSLIRAGVAATLQRDGGRVATITPGLHPVAALAAALPGKGRLPTLVVDQCEEVFSLCPDEAEREAFLTRLADHATAAPLILSFRADRLADISSHPRFAHVIENGMHLLTGMSEDELREAIVEPARLASLIVEPGLVDLLVGEVAGQPGALPLMSHVLAETWQRREGRTLTVAGYRASGGIQGAVAQSAEQVYARLTPEQQPMLRALLLRLVTPGPDGEPVRSRLPRRTVVTGPESDALIDLLISSRLVTSDDGVVELAHEALARAWPRLRGWLEDDLEGQQILHHLTQVADSWESLGRPESELYRGVRLAKALQWQHDAAPVLTPTETDFLIAGESLSAAELHAAEDRARQQIRVNRRLRAALTTAAVLLVGALIAGFLAVGQADRADRQATAADHAAVAADSGRAGAKAVVQSDIDTSLLLAVAGSRLDASPESRANLLAVLAKHPQLIRSIQTEKLNVYGLDVSPDGKTIVLFDANGTALLYDAASGRMRAAHRPKNRPDGAVHLDFVAPVAFDPSGRQLAIGMPPPAAQPVRLLDPATMEPAAQQLPGFSSKPARATHVGYSADGTSLVAMVQYYDNGTSNDFSSGAIFVWDVRSGGRPSLRRTLPLPAAEVEDVTLSPAGDRVYISKPLTAYDVATGRQLYRRPDLSFRDVDLSRDGKLLGLGYEATADAGPNARSLFLIDAANGSTRRQLTAPTKQVQNLRFSHDGTVLASSGSDLQVALWDVATGEAIDDIPVAEGEWLSYGFSPDDATLYTAAGDGAIRSWDLAGRRKYVTQLVKPPTFVYGCILVAPGARSVYRSTLEDYRFIDAPDGTSTKRIRTGPGEWTNSCGSWTPDGDRFATVQSGVVYVLDSRTGAVVAQRKAASTTVLDLDYSGRDASRLVIGDESGLVTLLDSQTLLPVAPSVQVGGSVAWLSASPDNRTAFVLTGGSHLSDRLDVPSSGWVLVDLQAGKVIQRGQAPFKNAEVVVFAPDGRHVAIGSGTGDLVVLDATTGSAVGPPASVHDGWTNSLAYSADSSLLVSAGADGSVTLFDGATAALLGSITTPEQTLSAADFLADGHSVLVATNSDGLYLWDTSLEHAIETACRMAGRDLTAQEWRENFGERAYRKTC